MNRHAEMTSTALEDLPKPNIIPLQRAPMDEEPPLPTHVQDGGYQELGSEVSYEWDPLTPWESLEGFLVGKTAMRLGGTAYTLQVDLNKENEPFSLVLLKKGGRILDACLRDVEIGECIYIRFRGLLPAKPGQNPARDWRVLKLKSV
jgi:hypothetical protein